MARGVAIPELREQLFSAAERVLARDGPTGLSSRAITTAAGCAKGVLHNHFHDLDGFLAEFVLAVFSTAHAALGRIGSRVGQATVADNLAETLGSLLTSPILAAHDILRLRPSLSARMHDHHGHHGPELGELEHALAAYLDAEKDLGRVLPDTDTRAVSLALVATVHHLIMIDPDATPDHRATLDRVLAVLLAANTPANLR